MSRHHRWLRVALPALVAAALAIAGLAPAQAISEVPTTALLTGLVRGVDDELLDNVNAEAFAAGSDTPVASMITYSSPDGSVQHGYFELRVPAGTYRVRLTPMDEEATPYEATFVGGGDGTEITVADGETRDLGSTTLTRLRYPSVSGQVLTPGGDPVGNARVQAFEWLPTGDGDTYAWDRSAVDEGTTVEDGSYHLELPRTSAPITLRFSASGFDTVFLGGGRTFPAAPGTSDSFTVDDSEVLAGVTTMAPHTSALGSVAGDTAAYCRENTLPANDDGSSDAVDVPFPLTFFGQEYDQLFVNNNGNVTFGSDLAQYTPSDLTGPTDVPIIAPFFADVDTRDPGSAQVTYGASPDGSTFCVNWADVGYFGEHSDLLDTFQLLLTKDDTGEGRGPGDFDITFNYDQVAWETGDASDGVDGLGGTSAAAGFSAGTGFPGTFVQLPGSFENGALLDGGPDALVSGFQGTTTPGRYIFEVRNAGQAELGGISGTVVDPEGVAVSGAYVQACLVDSEGCSALTRTDDTGTYDITALPVGDYSLNASPPDDALVPARGTATVAAGEITTADPIVMTGPQPLPEAATLTNAPGTGDGVMAVHLVNGIPTTNYHADLAFSTPGCAGTPNPTWTEYLEGRQVGTGPLTESPEGTFTAIIPATYPDYGDAVVSTNVPRTCDVGAGTISFNLYIDPSGVVTDQYGRTVSGASVTLRRADSQDGVYSDVPDGSPLLSPANRSNPDTTDGRGFFQWDVLTGWYRVVASTPDCPAVTTDAMQVPPARLDLLVRLSCPSAAAPVPTTAPALSGTAQVGQTLSATHGAWSDGIAWKKTEWLRDGAVVATGSSYVLSSADQGKVITARVTAQRPDYTQESGTGAVVSFAETHVDLSSDAVAPAAGGGGGGGGGGTTPAAPVATTLPSVSGAAKVGRTLTAEPGSWTLDGLTYRYQWLRDGQPIAGVDGRTYTATAPDLGKRLAITVTASKAGVPDGSATSAPVTVEQGDAPTPTALPTVSGEARVGGVLHASSGSWDLEGLAFGYRWLRDGRPIAGATGADYAVGADDAGAELVAVVTATKEGYADASATSNTVSVADVVQPSPVTSTTFATLADSTIRAPHAGTVKVRVSRSDHRVPTGILVVRMNGKRVLERGLVRRDHGRVEIALPKVGPGVYKVRVRYEAPSGVEPSRSFLVELTVKPARHHDKGEDKGELPRRTPLPVS